MDHHLRKEISRDSHPHRLQLELRYRQECLSLDHRYVSLFTSLINFKELRNYKHSKRAFHRSTVESIFPWFPPGLEIRENLEKWEGIFQPGKSQGILSRLEKSGNFTQNTGKIRKNCTGKLKRILEKSGKFVS